MAAKLEEISSRVRPGLRSDAVPLGELEELEPPARDRGAGTRRYISGL